MLNLDQDDVDPRMERVVQTLGAKLECFKGVFLSDQVVDRIDRLLKEHRATWRLRGVDVPEMVAVVFPHYGFVEVLRKDLEIEGVQSAVVGFVQKFPDMTKEELTAAMFRAFPDYASKLQSNRALHAPMRRPH